MYALLALKSRYTQEGQPDRHLLTVQIISMGCFNGLNTPRAFDHGVAGGTDDLYIETNESGVPIRVSPTVTLAKAWGGVNAERQRLALDFNGWTAGPYETLGIGYINYQSGGQQKTLSQLQATGRTESNGKACPWVGELLLREGFLATYRNPVLGGHTPTLRVLTPNEQYLSNCFSALENGAVTFEANMRDTTSKLASTVIANRTWRGSLYQFVGSERPSGQAIAYLQAWRNCSEYSNGRGFEYSMKSGEHSLCVQLQGASAWRGKSVIAILSYLFNSGDDSDIITFSGNHYLSYCTKVGFWNTTNLYRDQSSMMSEGRYNKGGQSVAIRQNLQRIRSMSSRSATHAAWVPNLGGQLDTIRDGFNAVQNLVQHTSLRSVQGMIGSSSAAQDNCIRQVGDYMRAMWNANPMAHMNTFLNESNALPDLNVPVATSTARPTEPQGFVQWTSQAADTVH